MVHLACMPRTIVFEGEPQSTQTIYGNNGRGGRYLKPAAAKLKQDYFYEAKMQWSYGVEKRAFSVRIDFFFKDRKRRDLANHEKLILDALIGIVYEDDSQIDELSLFRRHDAERPRVEVTVVPL